MKSAPRKKARVSKTRAASSAKRRKAKSPLKGVQAGARKSAPARKRKQLSPQPPVVVPSEAPQAEPRSVVRSGLGPGFMIPIKR
jgi:hypothetical protein